MSNNTAAANILAFATETDEGHALRTAANKLITMLPGIENETSEARKDLFAVALGRILLISRSAYMAEKDNETKSASAQIWEAFAGSIYNELRK